MAKAVQHVAINCRNKDAQEEFFTKHFGFRRARVLQAGEPGEFVMLRLGETCIELFQAEDVAPDATGGPQDVGFKHFCFQVPSLEEKIAELNADGIETGPIIDCNDLVPGLRVCFFNDRQHTDGPIGRAFPARPQNGGAPFLT
ncbi:MAG: VOC family protein [Planctomycetota bacterium]|jgi:glyoxylase I family protein